MNVQEIGFGVTVRRADGGDSKHSVSALLNRPSNATCLYVLGHGAGAGMRHPFMEEIAGRLADAGVATFRYNFPYMEAGRRRPDHRKTLLATVTSAVVAAFQLVPDLPMFAGGKSMGGRMTSQAAAEGTLPNVVGLAFLGFPLHPPAKPSVERARHLKNVRLPMLFLQGTRDTFATEALLDEVVETLPLATLHRVAHGDHSFNVLKRSGRTREDVMDELIAEFCSWSGRITAGD